MAKDQGVKLEAARGVTRTARPSGVKVPVVAPTVAAPVAAKKRTSAAQFFREVRVEGRKTTWTPWKETWVISVMVFAMVAITAIFFSLVDGALSLFIQQILKLAG